MTELAKIPLAGVIGHPIAHSRSPALHGFWLRRYGVKGHYIPMDVAPADLETTLRHLPKIGFVGLNVTLPHKEAVLKIADVITDRAALIGAANTLIFRKDGKIHADNTDGAGFVANLRQNAPHWVPAAGSAAVCGAGGAARAVVAALIEVGYEELTPVVDTGKAFGAGSSVHDEAPDNQCYHWGIGDKAGTEEAFAKAAHVTTL
jgi:shikimate dehydrogenase